MPPISPRFSSTLIAWQRRHGRHGLPWQGTRDPYRLWVAEIMLQQTQVDVVISYYGRFIARFPDVAALARATQEEVLTLWSGLGYYARARNLHRAGKLIAATGKFPDSCAKLAALPGIGRSTAGAIAAFAFGERAAMLDGNAKRVFARCFGIEDEKRQWRLAEQLLPARGIGRYTQGLMDLGATVCTRARPACGRCPLARQCVARLEDRIDELPAPRRRRPLPLRRSTWLVLLHRGEVLLERRPGAGIWGGLWAFPELPVDSAASYCLETLGYEIKNLKPMPAFEHGFTHFRLKVRPIRCEVRRVLPQARSPGRIWLDIEEATRAAVPAPVKALLSGLLRQ